MNHHVQVRKLRRGLSANDRILSGLVMSTCNAFMPELALVASSNLLLPRPAMITVLPKR